MIVDDFYHNIVQSFLFRAVWVKQKGISLRLSVRSSMFLHLITDDTSIVIYDNINQKIRQYFRQNILVQMEKECGEILCILFVFWVDGVIFYLLS